MKVKYLLTALAVPAMFAACSQEEIVKDVQSQDALLGTIAGDVDFSLNPQSRMVWDAENNVSWEAEDGFSLFWVGDLNGVQTNQLEGKVNALYKKNNDVFTSQNIVYEGNHIIVYPADYAHLSAGKINVTVGKEQDNNVALGKRSVWTTDSLLTIKAPLTGDAKAVPGVTYAGGYGQAVPATLQALSSNLVLNLNFAMGNATNVTVKKVVLKSDKAVFVVDGNLKADAKAEGKYNQDVKFVDGTPVDAVTLKVNEVVTAAKPELTVQFSMLSNTVQANLADAKYSIEVHTNYGIVTIDEAKNVLARSGSVYCNTASTPIVDKNGKANTTDAALDLSAEIKLMAQHNVKNYAYRTEDATKKTNITAYGKKIGLDVAVNMKDASIANMEVANSQELIDAYNIYILLEKDGLEQFQLKNEKPFELTPEAVEKILSNNKIVLKNSGNASIKLVGAHTSIPVLATSYEMNAGLGGTIKIITGLQSANESTLILGTEGTWAIDVDAATAANTWGKIVNDGTLTLSESNPAKNAVALTTAIANRGTVTFASNVDIPVAYEQEKGGTTTVGSDYTVNFTAATDIKAGSIDVDGKLITLENTTNIQKGVNVAVSGALLANNAATLNNAGTITLEGAGRTIITSNVIGEDNGSIVCASRESSVNVKTTAKGFIKWACNVAVYEKQDRDAFNYLILTDNVKIKGANDIKHLEINGAAVEVVSTLFGEQNKYNSINLDNVFVNAGKTMVVPTGSTVTTTNAALTGDVEVYGKFTYTAKTGTGKVYDYSNN